MNMRLDHKKTVVSGVELTSRAMVAAVNIRQWSGRKLDKRITAETNAAHNADSDAGRYNKLLIGKDAIAAIAKIAGKARNDFYWHTLPWLDNGGRILPAAGYDGFMLEMAKHRAAFEKQTREFVANYPALIEESRRRLNGMFDPADYPAPDDIAGRFSFDVAILPLPAANDFRIDRADSDAIRADIENRTNQAVTAAMRDTWQRVAETVGNMAEKLRDYQPGENGNKAANVFRDSLVSNLDNLVSILPGLNIAGDPLLEKITAAMRDHLAGLDANQLRTDSNLRAQTVRKAETIKNAMAQFMA